MTDVFFGAAIAALLHITPTVALVKRADAVAHLLPGADAFVAREVHLSAADAHRLHEAVDWSPEDDIVTFYIGRRSGGGETVGALLFVRVDTPHGPLEVAVGFAADGTVRGVDVTKATVETKPWVLEAIDAGLATRYAGLKAGDTPAGAVAVEGRVGALPHYMGEQVDKGVARALAAYGLFFR